MAASIFVQIDLSDLQGLASAFRTAPAVAREETARAVYEADAELLRTVQDETAPKRTGGLIRSVGMRQQVSETGVIGMVTSSIAYVVPVELGSKPHDIVARSGKALEFFVGGRKIYRRKVHHPGSTGRFMFKRAFERRQPDVRDIFRQALMRIAERLGESR